MSHNLDKNVGRESDGRVLPTKCPNKGGSPTPAESMEGRRPTKENTGQTAASQIQSWENALAGLHRVREAAKREKRLRFTSLLHHVSVVLLSNSFYALKREAAPGVDGLTWQEYETDLDKRLEDLHSRVHRGTYRALPSKRAYILKQDGRQRPLGIASLEDKIVQHAVGTVLNQIYEEDFLGFSYGFRPGCSAHDALDASASEARSSPVSVAGGSREMVEACGSRLLQLSRRTRQSRQSPEFSVRSSQTLAAGDSPSQSAEREDVGAPGPICG